MFASSAKQVISALLALQIIASVVAQAPVIVNGGDIEIWNVTTKTEDYIQENRRQYNATLQSYLDEINGIKESLDDQLLVLDKQKALVLSTIQETNEKLNPLEVLSLPTKHCVQKYRAELPYANIVKGLIESCISNARSYATSIVSTPTSYYNTLNNYYNIDLKNNLNACAKSHANPSLNHTLCVTTAISKANTYTINSRKNFATSIESSHCSLSSRIDIAVSCTYTQYNAVLTSIGSATRMIDECINGYLENTQCVNNTTVVNYGCPHVVYMEVKDGAPANRTAKNPLEGIASNQTCLEIKFV
uniref:Plasma membrane fusion protein prm1 n=1 Tax=Zeugodacus cucurbitae TaxID=28588 RepID=A0A0A1X5U3_ZEUCU